MHPKAATPLSHTSVLPSSPDAMAALRGSAPGWYRRPPPPRREAPGVPREKPSRTEAFSSDYPSVSVIVVGTQGEKAMQYRVGLVTSADFEEGLRLDDGALNPTVAKRCFGASKVYKQAAAEEAARDLYDRTFYEAVQASLGERHARPRKRTTENEERNLIEQQADVDACKQVCGIKVLHLNCKWPE